MIIIVVLGFLAGGYAFPPQEAFAATIVISDEATCEQPPIGGFWQDVPDDCTVSSDLTVPEGDSWTISSGVTFIISGSELSINGSLINNGRLLNSGTIINNESLENNDFLSNSGSLVNHGDLINDDNFRNSGTMTNNGNFANTFIVENVGTLINSATGTFSSDGVLVSNFDTIINNGGAMHFDDLLDNDGVFTNNDNGTIINDSGTIANDGIITNNEGSITNNNNIANLGVITNAGNLTINLILTNQGTMNNTGLITISDTASLSNQDILENHGTIENSGGLTNFANGVITSTGLITNNDSINNMGIITNDGDLVSLDTITINDFGILINNGDFTIIAGSFSINDIDSNFTNPGDFISNGDITNSGNFTNAGDFTNNGDFNNIGDIANAGTMTNTNSLITFGSLINNGTITNLDFLVNTGSGTLTNNDFVNNTSTFNNFEIIYNIGVFDNDGALNNNDSFDNSGIVNIKCDGTLDGLVIFGNQPIDACAPIANAQVVGTDEEDDLEITIEGSNPDAEADFSSSSLVFFIESQPSNGTLALTGINSSASAGLIYTPDVDFFGTDSFAFLANDGTNDGLAAIVSITVNGVNDAPVANAQSIATDEDEAVIITLTAFDPDGDLLTFLVDTGPGGGEISGLPPNITYDPEPDFNGADSFTFFVNDGTVDSNFAIVSITVNPVDEEDDNRGNGGGGNGKRTVVVNSQNNAGEQQSVEIFPDSHFEANPLDRFRLGVLEFLDSGGISTNQTRVAQQVSVTGKFSNHQSGPQNYAFIVQVIDEDETVVYIGWQQASIERGTIAEESVSWRPEQSGNYSVKIFMWDSLGLQPTPLSVASIKYFAVTE